MVVPSDLNDISGIVVNLWSHLDVTNDGSDKASAWGDQSSEENDLSQSSSGIRPSIVADTLNGFQGIEFSRSVGTYIDRSSLVSGARSATSWVALYMKMTNTSLSGDEFISTAIGSPRLAIFYDGSTGELKLFNGSTVTGDSELHTIDTDFHLIFVQFRGSTTRIYVDGVQIVEGNDGGGTPSDGFRLGARFDAVNSSDCNILHASAGDGDIIGTSDFDLIHDVPSFYESSDTPQLERGGIGAILKVF